MKLLPSRRGLCTPYNRAPCHFMQSHIRKVYACLAVTCHLHFWQNDRGLLRATAVTRGWNGYRNNPPNSNTDCRIFNVRMPSVCMRAHTGDLGLHSHPKGFCEWSPHRIWLRRNLGAGVIEHILLISYFV